MTVVIENSDILQACVTVLIGVLIFLTLERKFEKKDLTSYRLELQHQRSRALHEVERLSNKVVEVDGKLGAEGIDPEDANDLRRERIPLEERRISFAQELTNIEELIHKIDSAGKIDDSIAAHYQKIKDREDMVNSIAVTFLSICVIFMITVSPDYKTDYLNYFTESRFFFAAGIGALVIRVFLYTWDVKSTKPTKQKRQ